MERGCTRPRGGVGGRIAAEAHRLAVFRPSPRPLTHRGSTHAYSDPTSTLEDRPAERRGAPACDRLSPLPGFAEGPPLCQTGQCLAGCPPVGDHRHSPPSAGHRRPSPEGTLWTSCAYRQSWRSPASSRVVRSLRITDRASTKTRPSHHAGLTFFENKVRPILAEHCYRCHGPDSGEGKAKLRVDSLEALLKGGVSGPAIVRGEPGPEPADPRRSPRRRRVDAAQEEARAGRDRCAHRLGQDGGALARLRQHRDTRGRRRHRPAMARIGAAVLGVSDAGGRRRRRRSSTHDGPAPRSTGSSWRGSRPPGCIRRRRPTSGRSCAARRSICWGIPPYARRDRRVPARRFRRRRSSGSSTACSRRRDTASAGAGTGWTSSATPTPTAWTTTSPTPTPGAIAITSSARSTPTSRSTGSSKSRSPATCSPSRSRRGGTS